MSTTVSFERSSFSEKCAEDFTQSDVPTGSIRAIGPYDTVYVVAGSGTTEGTPAVVLFSDIFGLSTSIKLLADILCQRTGCTVYVPDIFDGDALPIEVYSLPGTAEEAAHQGVVSKLWNGMSFLSLAPWFVRHRLGTKTAAASAFIEILRGHEYGHSKIGAIGCRYGTKLAARLLLSGPVSAVALLQPGTNTSAAIEAFHMPDAFALVAFTGVSKERPTRRGNLKAKDGQVITYAGSCLRLADRGELQVAVVRKAGEGALVQVTDWFAAHLV